MKMPGEKEFRCDKCPYAASQKGKLQRHVKGVHKNVKPYQCEKCSYTASQKDSLQRHVRRYMRK